MYVKMYFTIFIHDHNRVTQIHVSAHNRMNRMKHIDMNKLQWKKKFCGENDTFTTKPNPHDKQDTFFHTLSSTAPIPLCETSVTFHISAA